MLEKIRKFVELADLAKEIVETNMSWKTKYELVFSDDIRGGISDTDIYFDWLDPDTTYEADVLAYVNAICRKADELREIL